MDPYNKPNREKDFSKISSVDDMIEYLDDSAERLKNRKYLYHYTKIQRVIDIFDSKKWHLSNASCTNDQLEFANGDPMRWKNMFFASFMTDVKESIGMWSMYAQPWEDGVLLTIPKTIFRNWIKSTNRIIEVSCADFKPTGRYVKVDDKNKLFLSSVAYSNCDNPEADEKLAWSTAVNTKIKNASHIPELTGYIKNSAWDYEREIRIKAVLSEGHGFQRAAIDIPETVLNSITIFAGPLFEGKLEDRLKHEVLDRAEMSVSMFRNRLLLGNHCTDCTHRK